MSTSPSPTKAKSAPLSKEERLLHAAFGEAKTEFKRISSRHRSIVGGGDTYAAQRGEREPTHPGSIIQSGRLALAERPSLRVMAEAIGISHEQLNRLEKGTRPVTAEYDLLICRYFGMETAGIFLRMQHAYDMWHAEKKLKARLAKIVPAERA